MWIFAPNFNDKQTKLLRVARKLPSSTPIATQFEDFSNQPQFQRKTMTLFRGS
ncbi:hypothetical protein AciX8_1933 [Granulicella mallensis MP5ACTX8]|uniref:Uncharacterized protein n=1 Tax=Granulicella mallensis (strain ATCC BAA-1857 / DSM 23137 / MP5ACTX8) TaxID=682795 RepID=G8NS56_GRAMM|nr:hypothetical protein AciX8_1933 [Granulicella mallensis MP5ACTX8]